MRSTRATKPARLRPEKRSGHVARTKRTEVAVHHHGQNHVQSTTDHAGPPAPEPLVCRAFTGMRRGWRFDAANFRLNCHNLIRHPLRLPGSAIARGNLAKAAVLDPHILGCLTSWPGVQVPDHNQ